MPTDDYLGLTPQIYQDLMEACEEGNPERIASFWVRYPKEFADIRVIAHDPTAQTQSSLDAILPKDANLDDVVWLQGLYAAGNLRCYDARTVPSLLSAELPESELNLDVVFLCDNCIVSYCGRLWKGDKPLQSNIFHRLQLAGTMVSLHGWQRFDPVCYSHENLDRLGEDPAGMEEKMFCRLAGFYLWLQTPTNESKDGFITSRGDQADRLRHRCEVQAKSRMQEWKRFVADGSHDRLRLGSKFTRLALLRALYEQWKAPARELLARKVVNLLTFFDEQAFTIPKLEVAVALHLLGAGKVPDFLHPLQRNTPSATLFEKIGAMAWDLMHLRESALWAAREFSVGGESADLTAPYLLTADRTYAAFMPALQIKALVTRKGSTYYETILSRGDVFTQVRGIIGEDDTRRFFNLEATRQRAARRPTTFDARESLINRLIDDCEAELRLLYEPA